VTDLVDRLKAFRQGGDTRALVDAVPYARFLGLSIELEEGRIIGRMPFADHLVGNPVLPALHGGTLGGLLESTAIFQLLWEAETLVLPKIINLTVQYLRSGRPLDTSARAVITKHGRRVASVRAEAWQDDPARPIATATAHFLILPSDG
jgi:acyl-coenzyme A thioesterase PaaI-like protein